MIRMHEHCMPVDQLNTAMCGAPPLARIAEYVRAIMRAPRADLEEDVEHIVVRLLHLVEKDNRVWPPPAYANNRLNRSKCKTARRLRPFC